jgi:hypothetical protein
MTAVAACRSCRMVRDLSELLEVVNVHTGAVSYICRPESARPCFRRLRPASVERISDPAGPTAWPRRTARQLDAAGSGERVTPGGADTANRKAMSGTQGHRLTHLPRGESKS